MKEYNVHFTDHRGRTRSRYFYAPNLEEAQEQFKATVKVATNENWREYGDMPSATYKDYETGEILTTDTLYEKYLEQYPTKEITFVAFIGDYAEKI